MLYISTRDKTASYTAYRTLHEDTAPDGGMYLPFKWPEFTEDQLRALPNRAFGENVACVLNAFFGLLLTGRDIDLCIGRNPLQSRKIGHRLAVYEMWHNPQGAYCQLERDLYRRIYAGADRTTPTRWACIAIRIALLFGILGQQMAENGSGANLVVTDEDEPGLCAAWYAKRLGLPVEQIIYCGREESGMWEFLSHGCLSTRLSNDAGLEWLIYSALGADVLTGYVAALKNNSTYVLEEEQLERFKQDIFPAVVGKKRVWDLIRNVYKMNGYILGADTAIAYGGQQDHRACTGETGNTIMLSLCSPMLDAHAVSNALDVEISELPQLLENFKE